MNSTDHSPETLKIPEGFKPYKEIARIPHINTVGPFFHKRENDEQIWGVRVNPHNINGMKHAHGGMLMTFADFALCSAAMKDITDRVATVSLNVDFVSFAILGAWLEARIKRNKVTGSLCYLSGECHVKHRLILQFTGVVKRFDKEIKT